MPPHCDSWDGPVVKAALEALREGTVSIVLPYVPADAEDEVRTAFMRTIRAMSSVTSEDLAVQWFCETVVRLHRAGEGAQFTGLKPAGLSHGPAVPLAERAIESGDPGEVAEFLCRTVVDEVRHKFGRVMELREQRDGSVEQAREYVEAMLGFQVWSHKTYKCITSAGDHGHGHAAG